MRCGAAGRQKHLARVDAAELRIRVIQALVCAGYGSIESDRSPMTAQTLKGEGLASPPRAQGKRVAVMQPYFFPYAGYYRLLSMVDHFVIYDCVQFPRRGRVHRTEVIGPSGAIEWLTLPLARQPRDTLIRNLAYAPDARAIFDARLARYAWHASGCGEARERILAHLHRPLVSVNDDLEAGLRLVAELLGLTPIISRSSSLGLPPTLRAQERMIAAVRAVGGTHYVNAPGGRAFYSAASFDSAGLKLSFLTPYEGPSRYFLPALLTLPLPTIIADIQASSRLAPP